MKRGKRLTVRQHKAVQAIGIKESKDWLFLKHPEGENMTIIHRYTGQTREVPHE
ncbi:DUF6906 family protein [Bacillus massiliglaciei]|uniref:DUF6906 family protein n=1 Tax=Bacillus massiliglaciei TaxID=1816693 RepID=UPI0018FE40E3|nr:hypothetical protein [Bacillus massiliglaciei]